MRDCRTRATMSSMSDSAAAASLLSIMRLIPLQRANLYLRPRSIVRCDIVGNLVHRLGYADDAHVVDARDQLDLHIRRDRMDGIGICVRQHQLVVGAGDQ